MTAPLRITHVVNTDQFAGLERYVIEVGTELARRGHDVVVVGGEPAAMTRLLEPPVRWTPGTSAPESLRALVSGGRRDIIHSHITKADFVATMAAPVSGGARVSTRHITASRGYTALAGRLARPVRALLAREIAVSRWTSDQLETPSDTVLLNAVRDVPDVTAPRERVVLVAQRLAPEKDTATALRAWARSGLASTGWRLVIAGSGDERPALEKLVAQLGITTEVEFVGWLADPTERFRSASILLAPAPTEPCGLTILEAMAHGLPVVAAGSGGNLETVGQHPAAALFAPGDDGAAGAHLARLGADDDARAQYGVSLRELQREQFTIGVHVDRLEQIYRQVAPRRRRG